MSGQGILQHVAQIFVWLFFIGVIGSMIVVVLSFIEDLELLLESDEEPSVDAARPQA